MIIPEIETKYDNEQIFKNKMLQECMQVEIMRASTYFV